MVVWQIFAEAPILPVSGGTAQDNAQQEINELSFNEELPRFGNTKKLSYLGKNLLTLQYTHKISKFLLEMQIHESKWVTVLSTSSRSRQEIQQPVPTSQSKKMLEIHLNTM